MLPRAWRHAPERRDTATQQVTGPWAEPSRHDVVADQFFTWQSQCSSALPFFIRHMSNHVVV